MSNESKGYKDERSARKGPGHFLIFRPSQTSNLTETLDSDVEESHLPGLPFHHGTRIDQGFWYMMHSQIQFFHLMFEEGQLSFFEATTSFRKLLCHGRMVDLAGGFLRYFSRAAELRCLTSLQTPGNALSFFPAECSFL